MKTKLLLLLLLLSRLACAQIQIGDDIDGAAAGDNSGQSLSLNNDGNIVAVGAYGNDGNGSGSGHVRVFENILGVWTQVGGDIDGEATGDNSGLSVSLNSDGSIMAIGARGNDGINDSVSEHVRVYDLSTALSVEQNTFGSSFSVYPNPTNSL